MVAIPAMFVRRPKARSESFSLLFLEEGEYYFDDFSAGWFPPDGDAKFDPAAMRRQLKGRMKVCSRSLMFVPEDSRFATVRFPFKDVKSIVPYESLMDTSNVLSNVFSVSTDCTVLMRDNNTNHPYRVVKKNETHLFKLNYVNLSSFLPRVLLCLEAYRLPSAALQEDRAMKIIEDFERGIQFNLSWLEDLSEKPLFETKAFEVSPLVKVHGHLVLTHLRVYFQPFSKVSADPVKKINLRSIRRILKRRYDLQSVGVELFCEENEEIRNRSDLLGLSVSDARIFAEVANSVLFSFSTMEERDLLVGHLLRQELPSLDSIDLFSLTNQWQGGKLSNFDYLMHINILADRSFNDLTQYPVFPWVIADYRNDSLDLNDSSTFRNLSKPIGALNPARLKKFIERFREMKGDHAFLYGTHYSTPGYVLFYLMRMVPEVMLSLQNGKFDQPDRLFHSLEETWSNVKTSPTDVKEVVPEFYCGSGGWLLNQQGVNFGTRQGDGVEVNNVGLPPWAGSTSDFVSKCRAALESDFVSQNLHAWIDLIFGYKQRGDEAVKSNNLFYYVTYENAVNFSVIKDPVERRALEAQIVEFGQTPTQLFRTPHPRRSVVRTQSRDAPTLPVATDETTRGLSSLSVKEELGKEEVRAEVKPSAKLPAVSLLRCEYSFALHRGKTTDMCLSKDGKTLFSVSEDTTLKIYSLQHRKQLRSVNVGQLALSSVALSEDGRHILMGSWDNHIYVYSIQFGRILDSLQAHDDAVSSVILRGERVFSTSWDASVRIWKWSPRSNQIGRIPVQDFIEHETEIKAFDVSTDGSVAVSGSSDGAVFLWDLVKNSPREIVGAHSREVTCARFTLSGNHVVTASRDCCIKVFRPKTGEEVTVINVGEPLYAVWSDDSVILTGGESGDLRVFDFWSGHERQRLQAHRSILDGICMGELDARPVMVTSGSDGVRLWQFSSPVV